MAWFRISEVIMQLELFLMPHISSTWRLQPSIYWFKAVLAGTGEASNPPFVNNPLQALRADTRHLCCSFSSSLWWSHQLEIHWDKSYSLFLLVKHPARGALGVQGCIFCCCINLRFLPTLGLLIVLLGFLFPEKWWRQLLQTQLSHFSHQKSQSEVEYSF